MRRIIRGKAYDTNTAKLIAVYTFGYPGEDEYFRESLYRTANQAFFLACEGRGGSYHARIVRRGVTSPGDDVIPLSDQETMRWLEEHEETECMETLFGPFPEAGDNKQLLCTRVPSDVFRKVKQAADREETTIEQWLAGVIGSALQSGKYKGQS